VGNLSTLSMLHVIASAVMKWLTRVVLNFPEVRNLVICNSTHRMHKGVTSLNISNMKRMAVLVAEFI